MLKTIDGYDIEKISTSSLSGDIRQIPNFKSIVDNLGIDWLTSDKINLLTVVQSWSSRAKKIASLLIDQHEISGIGVAWGCEILNDASIHPSALANGINIEKLVDSMISIRESAMKVYDNYDQDPEKFVEDWYKNLYFIRRMNVYNKGTVVMISGRKFYTQA